METGLSDFTSWNRIKLHSQRQKCQKCNARVQDSSNTYGQESADPCRQSALEEDLLATRGQKRKADTQEEGKKREAARSGQARRREEARSSQGPWTAAVLEEGQPQDEASKLEAGSAGRHAE